MSAAAVVSLASERGLMLATAESCTGGLIAAALTGIAGSSAAFDRGFVTYSNAAKQDMLGVSAQTLSAHGAVSEPVAAEMAKGALRHSQAALAVAVTGIAGPGGGTAEKPVGMVCFGYATHRTVETTTVLFGDLGRDVVRASTVEVALSELLSRLQAVAELSP